MRKNLFIFIIFISYTILCFSAEKSKLDMVTEQAVIDFDNNEFSAEGGIQFKYNDIKLKAYKLQKFQDMNVIQAQDKVIFEKGENKVEATKLTLNLDYEEALMNNGLSYVLVEKAPERHNRLYYGGEQFTAHYPDSAYIKNGWFTTSHRALKIKDSSTEKELKEILPYHMKAKKISVYPGDKLIAYNTTLYIHKVPVLWLPWYATSLKSDTQAPLFPKFGSDDDYGSYIVWGLDYGRNSDYFNGSIALRESSKRGTFIDQWDNVYKIKGNKNNSGKLSLSEALFAPKGIYEEQWKFKHTHEYKGEKGTFNWTYQNQTINTINTVEDDQDDAEDDGETDPYKAYEQKMLRYQLEADLSKLGKEEDISIYGKIQYVDNEEVLQKIIESSTEDTLDDDDDAEIDNEMETNIKLTKDNRKYKIMLHYDKFKDLDPGSVTADTKSFSNQNEYELDLKKYGIDMYYNLQEQDEWRGLSSSERESDGVELKDKKGLAYNPYTITKYIFKRTEEHKLTLGDYEIIKDYNLKMEYYNKTYKEKLNLEKDPFKRAKDYDTIRDREYNGSVDIIEKETEDEYYNTKLTHNTKSLTLELGSYFETYKDRENYEDDNYTTYTNDSDYSIIEIQDTKISLKKFGYLNAKYSFRQDIYKEKDELQKHNLDLVFSKKLYDNTWDFSRKADIKLKNQFGYSKLFYNYDAKDRVFPDEDDSYIDNSKDAEKYRLDDKKEQNFFNDTVTLELGNTVTVYNVDLKYYYDAYDPSWKTDEDFQNSIDFKVDDNRTVYVLYKTGDDFQEDGYNNQNSDSWKLTLADTGREFTYSNSRVYSRVRKLITDTTSNYSERTTSYPFLRYEDRDKSDTYSYGFGENKVKWWTLSYQTVVDQTYKYNTSDGLAYNKYSDDNFKKTYSLKYVLGEEKVKAHLFDLKYIDYLDRDTEGNSYYEYTFEYSYTDNKKDEEDEEKKVVYEDEKGEYQVVLTKKEEEELEQKLTALNKQKLGSDFDLMGIGEVEDDVIYKRYYRIYLTAKVNKDYAEENDSPFSAMEEFKIRSEFHHERTKLTYEFTEENDIDYNESEKKYSKDTESRTHEFTLTTKFGKLDHSWTFKTEVTFEDYIENSETDKRLDEFSLEVGKEFEYAQWAVGYDLDWNTTYRRYDYTVSFKVSLLTFPEKAFGLKNDKGNLQFEAGM